LQLTLESDRLHEAIQSYVDQLGPRTVGAQEVIGIAVSVNGRLQSAEIYGSSGLFMELWPKLLRANAIAALAERQAAHGTAPTVDEVQRFVSGAEKGSQCRRTQTEGTVILQQESDRAVLFETCDPVQQNVVLHRSILAK